METVKVLTPRSSRKLIFAFIWPLHVHGFAQVRAHFGKLVPDWHQFTMLFESFSQDVGKNLKGIRTTFAGFIAPKSKTCTNAKV